MENSNKNKVEKKISSKNVNRAKSNKKLNNQIKPKSEQNLDIKEINKKELMKLEIKLLRKLYDDLFISNPKVFKDNEIKFETFVYEFGLEIHELYQFDKNNQNYDNLLNDAKILLFKKYQPAHELVNYNKKQLKKYFNDLCAQDEWTLIEKYKQEMYKNEQNEKLKQNEEKIKKYYQDLKSQIEEKKRIKIIEKEKKQKEEQEKIIELNKIKQDNLNKLSQLKSNENLLECINKNKIDKFNIDDKLKQEYIKELENDIKNINDSNKYFIKNKLDNVLNIQTKQFNNCNNKILKQTNIIDKSLNSGFNFEEDDISSLVDNIIKQKYENKYKENYKIVKENDDLNDNNTTVNNNIHLNFDGVDLELEKKVNNILKKYNQIYKDKNT